MKLNLSDELFFEAELLTSLIETVDTSQAFNNPQALVLHVLADRTESNDCPSHEKRVLH